MTNPMRRIACLLTCCALLFLLAACGGGSGSSSAGAASGCSGNCANASTFLTVSDAQQVIAQAVAEATAQQRPATIVVADRVGNVLAAFRMNGAAGTVRIDSGRGVSGGLEGVSIVPDTLAAIAKALTAAYLSSEGNAFSTRTASQIIEEHFNPGELGAPAGPLFGVQFSQLPCSDLNTRFGGGTDAGPKRSPLGLSADPGGLPLYKDGTPVGAVGVMADGVYGLDLNITDTDRSVDELIAVAATYAFAAPVDRRADHITAEGKTLRYADVDFNNLARDPATAPGFASINGVAGNLVDVTGYYTSAAGVLAGLASGQPASGIRADSGLFPGLDAFVLVDNANVARYPPIDGTESSLPEKFIAPEVREILRQALMLANRARAQIRQPLGSPARVSIAVVDTNGAVLGIAQTRDAPVFGIDVALQKARTAAFFSNTAAAAELSAAPDAEYFPASPAPAVHSPIGAYVSALRTFLGRPGALADGVAFSDRAIANLARPFFPDGIDGNASGPFSKAFADWSPFSDGLQLDLVNNAILTHVTYVLGGGADVGNNCTTLTHLPNGMQIFPGGVPVYRGATLIGGVGVSGDGVDQDDMMAFLGVNNAGLVAGISIGTPISNAPLTQRADTFAVPDYNVNLRYVQCPQTPFLDSSEQNVCAGK